MKFPYLHKTEVSPFQFVILDTLLRFNSLGSGEAQRAATLLSNKRFLNLGSTGVSDQISFVVEVCSVPCRMLRNTPASTL